LPTLRPYVDSSVAVSPVGLSTADKQLVTLAVRAATQAVSIAPAKTVQQDEASIQMRVLASARHRMEILPEPLRTTGLAAWDEMRLADRNHEIVLMPQLFAEQLLRRVGSNDRQLVALGEANFFCWIATILYDDFIDEEGEPARLPIANVAYRTSLQLYRRVLAHAPRRYAYVERMYTAVDRANAWEVMYTRAPIEQGVITLNTLPHYGNRMVLADRAFGHAIGPMLLVQQVPGVRIQQVRLVQVALQHYLIARQLNDDIHDWRKDLRAGQLNVVVTDMLQALRVRSGRYDIESLVARLERRFLYRGLERQCTRLIEHVQACRRALAASGLTKSEGGFMRLVDDLEASAIAARQVQADEQAFLQTYQQLGTPA
jgi:hypothetical protein